MRPNSELEKKTRRVFHDLHIAHLNDEQALRRHSNSIEPQVMGLPDDYFVGLNCADLGCGSAAHGTANLLSLGAGYVWALDLDETFIEPASNRLQAEESYSSRTGH